MLNLAINNRNAQKITHSHQACLPQVETYFCFYPRCNCAWISSRPVHTASLNDRVFHARATWSCPEVDDYCMFYAVRSNYWTGSGQLLLVPDCLGKYAHNFISHYCWCTVENLCNTHRVRVLYTMPFTGVTNSSEPQSTAVVDQNSAITHSTDD